jgi:small-conductance mechanosensitive channel
MILMNEPGKLVDSALEFIQTGAPKALLCLAIGIGGVTLSWLARRLAAWTVRRSGLEAVAERAGAAKLLYKVGARQGVTPLVQSLVWYLGLLATLAVLSDALGLTGLTQGVASVLAFIPRVVASVALLAGGFWLAGLVRGLLDRLNQSKDTAGTSSPVGQVAYTLVLVLSITVALDQLGIEVTLLSSLIQLALGAAAFALALAFALGGRQVFENILARHYCGALVSPGDRIRVGEIEGTVVRLSAVSVIIASADAELVLPCSTVLTTVTQIRRLGSSLDTARRSD